MFCYKRKLAKAPQVSVLGGESNAWRITFASLPSPGEGFVSTVALLGGLRNIVHPWVNKSSCWQTVGSFCSFPAIKRTCVVHHVFVTTISWKRLGHAAVNSDHATCYAKFMNEPIRAIFVRCCAILGSHWQIL